MTQAIPEKIAGIVLRDHDCKVCGRRLDLHELPDFARCLRKVGQVERLPLVSAALDARAGVVDVTVLVDGDNHASE